MLVEHLHESPPPSGAHEPTDTRRHPYISASLAFFHQWFAHLCFGLGRGPITPPGPAMALMDRKGLNSNKTNKKQTKPRPGTSEHGTYLYLLRSAFCTYLSPALCTLSPALCPPPGPMHLPTAAADPVPPLQTRTSAAARGPAARAPSAPTRPAATSARVPRERSRRRTRRPSAWRSSPAPETTSAPATPCATRPDSASAPSPTSETTVDVSEAAP